MSDYQKNINRHKLAVSTVLESPLEMEEMFDAYYTKRDVEEGLMLEEGKKLFGVDKELIYQDGAYYDQRTGQHVPTDVRGVVMPSLGPQPSAAKPLADKGMKHDTDKEPLSLLSRVWLTGVAKVMSFGAKKYAAHNWRSGIERSRLLSAALRHILAYNEGEDLDPETGLSHLDHASCCLMFARETHDTHPKLDDRWKGKTL